jgi:hypothetical protein
VRGNAISTNNANHTNNPNNANHTNNPNNANHTNNPNNPARDTAGTADCHYG